MGTEVAFEFSVILLACNGFRTWRYWQITQKTLSFMLIKLGIQKMGCL